MAYVTLFTCRMSRSGNGLAILRELPVEKCGRIVLVWGAVRADRGALAQLVPVSARSAGPGALCGCLSDDDATISLYLLHTIAECTFSYTLPSVRNVARMQKQLLDVRRKAGIVASEFAKVCRCFAVVAEFGPSPAYSFGQ